MGRKQFRPHLFTSKTSISLSGIIIETHATVLEYSLPSHIEGIFARQLHVINPFTLANNNAVANAGPEVLQPFFPLLSGVIPVSTNL
jgi:hypothetical protein